MFPLGVGTGSGEHKGASHVIRQAVILPASLCVPRFPSSKVFVPFPMPSPSELSKHLPLTTDSFGDTTYLLKAMGVVNLLELREVCHRPEPQH